MPALRLRSITAQLHPGTFELSWQTTGGNWQLQYRTNLTAAGSGANWTFVPGVVTNPFVLPIDQSHTSAFYRLILTNY